MVYKCEQCEYETDVKSNLERHKKSLMHMQSTENNNGDYICSKCGKHFLHFSSLSRHENYRCIKMKSELDIIKIQLVEYQASIKAQKVELENEYLKKELSIVKQQNTELKTYIDNNKLNPTYKVSVKNYVQQNYPDAPALEPISDYSKLEYEDNEFIDTLTYNHNHSCLHKYLGDFIIKYYKKENPSEQSLWSSDTARLTYVIKELLANKKSSWNHDYKGVKTKDYIVNPLLNYVKGYIEEYWIKHIDDCLAMKHGNLIKFNNIYNTIYKIKKDIENDILAGDIVRYIAPYFYMNKKDKIDITDTGDALFIPYFIDNDI